MTFSHRLVRGKSSSDRRYFITSAAYKTKESSSKIRKHWAVDVNFCEDECRIRSGFAPQNASWFRCLAISLLKNEPTKLSINRKMLAAGDSLTYPEKVLFDSAC